MKLQEEDQEIHAFFQALKEKDKNVPVPKFPEIKKTKTINWWIPIGIAATLLLGFFLLPKENASTEPPVDVIIFTLQQDENQEPQILIEEKTYLETWESPTSSLLAEY